MWIATYRGENNNVTLGNFFFKKDFDNEIPNSLYDFIRLYRENNIAVFDLKWRLSGEEKSLGQGFFPVNAHSVQFDDPAGDFPPTVTTSEEALNWLAQNGITVSNSVNKEQINFTNSDVIADILSVTHTLATTEIILFVYDEIGNKIIVPHRVLDTTTLSLDLSGFSIQGIWTIVIIG